MSRFFYIGLFFFQFFLTFNTLAYGIIVYDLETYVWQSELAIIKISTQRESNPGQLHLTPFDREYTCHEGQLHLTPFDREYTCREGQLHLTPVS